MVRNVAVLTGTRAEYGLLSTTMAEIEQRSDLSLSVVATGMHLSPRYGNTVADIRADGFEIDSEVHMLIDGDSGTAMAKSLGVGIAGLADAFQNLDPDIVLVLGDRDEALAGALAAAHMNIPVAHIHGGDSMHGATIDDSIRHAITKFAHLHFPASESSADRIRRLGEQQRRIRVVGAPGLDDILAGKYDDPDTVLERYGLSPDQSLTVVLQHPVTTQPERAGEQLAATLDAVDTLDTQVVLVYPNSDAGSDEMIDEIESRSLGDNWTTFRTLPRNEFLGLLAAADVLVGNSSSAIVEAPSLDLPVVDIGPRQDGRERTACVLSVPHEQNRIRDATEKCLSDEQVREQATACKNPYNYGGASEQICDHLAEVELNDELLKKKLTY